MSDVLLKVKGKKIPMNIFLKKVFMNVLLGMISSLHGVGKIKNIDLKIKL